jgi:hypothetical protein
MRAAHSDIDRQPPKSLAVPPTSIEVPIATALPSQTGQRGEHKQFLVIDPQVELVNNC